MDIDEGGEDEVDDSGIAENNAASFRIFPNPSQGQFTIEVEDIAEIRIFSADGKEVERYYPTTDRVVVSEFNRRGIFIVRILTTNGDWQTAKLIVQ
ncbi:MAG: T9SS type A sorting domain-containing protein [Crocinitomix sp.]|nr:T9SS type A sorting domain-containing protein [Crocinitomix sp.]